MATGIKCQKCGADNPISTLFCLNCSTKLDYSTFKSDPTVAKKRVSISIGGIIRTIILLVLMAIVGLLFWPLDVASTKANRQMAEAYKRKTVALDHAIRDGRVLDSPINDYEINALLRELVDEQFSGKKEGGSAAMLTPTAFHTHFTGQYITFRVLAHTGPVKISYEVVAKPRTGRSLYQAEIIQARMGHLKFPAFARGWIVSQATRPFGTRTRDHHILENTIVSQTGKGYINLKTVPNQQ